MALVGVVMGSKSDSEAFQVGQRSTQASSGHISSAWHCLRGQCHIRPPHTGKSEAVWNGSTESWH